MTLEEQKNKCENCKYSLKLSSNICYQFKFLGCTYGEYNGKWAAEIDKCPKKELKDE